jgi:hypothetical protein
MSPAITNLSAREYTIAQCYAMMKFYVGKRHPCMVWGAPGIGKTQSVWQLGRELKCKIIEFKTNIREPVDVRGIPMPDAKTGTTRWYVPDELPRVDRDGEFGILYIDEINTGTTQMMAVMMGLVLERRIGDYVLPEGWTVIASGNRVSDRAAAQRMPTALRNRFAHIHVKPDFAAWKEWANREGVSPILVAFLQLRERDIFHVMPKGDENSFPTPRSWEKAGECIDADRDIRFGVIAGHVGDVAAADFDAFLDLYETVGDVEKFVRDPQNALIPSEPSLRYAICTAIARMATTKNFDNVVAYANRLPREFQLLVVHDATTRDKRLKNTTAYTNWAIKNQDLIVQAA